MDGWMDGWTDGWIHEILLSNESKITRPTIIKDYNRKTKLQFYEVVFPSRVHFQRCVARG